MSKVALINLYYPESGYGDRLHYPPLGIAYLSEYLDEKKVNHRVIDMGAGHSIDEILKELLTMKPEWVGISVNSLKLKSTQDFIKRIKGETSAKIVVGGPHVTTQGKKIFSDLKYINYAVVGEGEESFYKLITNKPKETIKGLVYKDKNGKITSNERNIMENIDEIPFPKFKRFELDLYSKKSIPIISSRGCPFKCIFCQQSSFLSKKWRGVSAEYFTNVIKYWKKKGRDEIEILDDNFAFDNKRLEKIVELFVNENINVKLSLVGGVRVASATKKNLSLLKKMGVGFISFGIESFSNQVLRFIKKGTTEKQIEEVIKNSTEMGFKVRLFFIIGFPYQTKDSLKKTYELISKYPISSVRFFNLIPYENTHLMEWLTKNGELIYQPSEYMNDFKKYQNIPVFKAKHTIDPDEREKELKIARTFEKEMNVK